jgi:hypothetical protein
MEKQGISRNFPYGKCGKLLLAAAHYLYFVRVFETFETTETGDTRAGEAVLAAAADQPAAPQACSGQ